MKKKYLLIIIIVIFIICGCSTKTEKKLSDETNNIELNDTITTDAYNEVVYNFMNMYSNVTLSQLISYMENDSISNTDFAKKFIKLFQNTNYENLSIKEKEFFDTYSKVYFGLNYGEYDKTKKYNILDLWSINYESDNKIDLNSCNHYNTRGFIIKLSDREERNTLISGIHKNDNYVDMQTVDYDFIYGNRTANLYNGELKKNNEKNTINTEKYCNFFTGSNTDSGNSYYVYEDKEKYQKIIDENRVFFNYLREYAKVYESNRVDKTTPEQIKEPKVGMTPEEVKKSTWGSPKKINKDTYSWGTTEQWVYNQGYIYFTNGKVTSISER